jgi:hypothetical protein
MLLLFHIVRATLFPGAYFTLICFDALPYRLILVNISSNGVNCLCTEYGKYSPTLTHQTIINHMEDINHHQHNVKQKLNTSISCL